MKINITTLITEVVTGLGTIGYRNLEEALQIRPGHLTHVTTDVYDQLADAYDKGNPKHLALFTAAWENGIAFARHNEGLRGRPPWKVEWKGPHKTSFPAIETLPIDLRIDSVFLISCKYGSTILHNTTPAAVFDHNLKATRNRFPNWFTEIAPVEYEELWKQVRTAAGLPATTTSYASRTDAEQKAIKAAWKSGKSGFVGHQEFCDYVSQASADRWRKRLRKRKDKAELYFRMLRMGASPYYLLGADKNRTPRRYRIDTPFDFSVNYTVTDFQCSPGSRGQPSVDWKALITNNHDHTITEVDGYIEVRPTRGWFCVNPEAKVHLTTDHLMVPGYTPLA